MGVLSKEVIEAEMDMSFIVAARAGCIREIMT